MSSRQQRIQTLYEISLSIGPKETLSDTAEQALSGYLQKLNCSVGGVYRRQADGSYEPVATVPTAPPSDGLLAAAVDALPVVHSTAGVSDALPMNGETDAGACYYLFELPEFGVLVLGKHTGELDSVTRSALKEVNGRLAEACQSQLTEHQLRKERNRFQAVFDAIPEPVARTVVEDGTEYIKACNKPFQRTFGLSEQTPGQGLLEELTPDTANWDRRPTDADANGRYVTTETTCPTREGSGEFLFHSVPVDSEHEAEYIQLYVDISEQKQRERELERYERLVENLPIGVFQTTPGPDGEFRLVNQGLVDILEAGSKSHFDDITPSDLYANPERRQEFSDRLLDEGAVDDVELQFETASGNPIWVEVSGIVSEVNGETVFELAMQDISARKERDQQLSVLNRVLRHNLRNAINVIEGNAALLANAVERDELQSCVSGIEQRVQNLEQLSEKAVTVRSVFEKGRRIDTVCDVGELLDTVANEFQDRHPEAAFTVGDFGSLYVRADMRLKLALTELVSNAIVHNDQPNPTVTMTATAAKENRDEEWVDIVIADNGPGIPTQEQNTIETGDETPLQHGTGLGLWLVYWAISLLGGDVRIDQSSSGTRVTLTLPRADRDDSVGTLDTKTATGEFTDGGATPVDTESHSAVGDDDNSGTATETNEQTDDTNSDGIVQPPVEQPDDAT